MNTLTEVYDKCIELLKVKSLDDSWSTIEADLKALLNADGPNFAKAEVLEDLRSKLNKASKGKGVAATAVADEIINACKVGVNGFQDRAALLKAMKHFYLVKRKGNQSIWVVDSPKDYPKWTFDEFSGATKEALKTALQKEQEVFGAGHRKTMSDSLQLARKWSSDVQVKLAANDKKTLEKVKRWFHAGEAPKDELAATVAVLLEGFKKIHATCNTTTVIFSDRPHLRAGGEWDNVYASVNSNDVMPVIYIFQVFLTTGKRNCFGQVPKLWLCALTVVHELSHKLVKTEDIRYDDDGLKPGASFTSDQALKNADSWAYFAADVVGVLTKGTIQRVLQ
ncbi:M35 family metallo-endopeptidase [Methylomonas sp. SURF-2]|uniref:M35 family metallo-endopeptidase n=1 Tax=Methylomonas subterranea TaxID=2952225 RepID=A0ABT1TJ49_9GAMM|nr:M35 family metallo-endopeptidase [Methylomonas sp. SURF-2]MCQ8105339.1 M35 family metallo-endopeptidase [Methylomonas sp. SURF-2]